MRHFGKLLLLLAALLVPFGCSLLNRHGPEVDCGDLQDGAVNACSDGIIASCVDGDIKYRVCEEDIQGVSADDICEASWQEEGAFKCAPDDLPGGSGPAKLTVGSVSIRSDSNSDGLLSPGETATVDIFAKNTGAEEISEAFAKLTSYPDSAILLSDCFAQGDFGSSASCTTTCDCTNVSSSSKQNFGGGQTGSYAMLRLEFRIADDVELGATDFEIGFEDSLGRTWTDSFQLDIVDTNANVHVGNSVIYSDSNDDGAVSPGEQISLRIFAENQGASEALGVTASLTSWDANVSISDCVARGDFGSSASCTSMCDCSNVSSSSKQNLQPASTGSYPVLEVDFALSDSAPATPITFGLTFADEWGNSWTDSVTLMVVNTGASIEVGSSIVYTDDNDDGQLSPGESATVRFFAENVGTSTVLELTASLTNWSSQVVLSDCVARGDFGSSATCTSACDCTNVSTSSKQNLQPSQQGSYPILEIDFTLSESAPTSPITFNVEFEDEYGNTWPDTVQFPVVATGANVQVSSAILWDDSGGDGQLSPGESGTVRVFAENVGTSNALDLTARATSSQVSITSCVARGNFGSSSTCVPTCNCGNVSSSSQQTLNVSQSGNYAILEADFNLSGGAPISPVTFNVTFEDGWGNTWNDSFQIPVVP